MVGPEVIIAGLVLRFENRLRASGFIILKDQYDCKLKLKKEPHQVLARKVLHLATLFPLPRSPPSTLPVASVKPLAPSIWFPRRD